MLSNAIKFSPKGGKVKLIVTTNEQAEEVKILVEDQGIGIPEEDLKHIFDRFYRSKNNKINGYGIGLSLVKNIVEEHQGQIQVHSTEQKGSVFQFTLPANLEANDGKHLEGLSDSIIPINVAQTLLEKSTPKETFNETLTQCIGLAWQIVQCTTFFYRLRSHNVSK